MTNENKYPRLDISKILLYQQCERRFFFEHILCKRSMYESYHLTFGRAFHEGMACIIDGYKEKNRRNILGKAMDAFDKLYYSSTDETEWDMYPNKSVSNAHLAFAEYMRWWAKDNYTPLFTEVAGEVLISPTRYLMFKIDAIIHQHDTNDLWIMEHKTASRKIQEQWQAHLQPKAYTHVLNSLNNTMKVGGTIMNTIILYDPNTKAAQTREYVNGFDRELLHNTPESMENFLLTLNKWYDKIYADVDLYQEEKEKELPLTAFPQACASCFNYFSLCPFNSICAYHIFHASEPFNYDGFMDYTWNPLKEYKILKVEETIC